MLIRAVRLYALAAAAALLPAPALADGHVVGGYSHPNDFFGETLVLDGDQLAVGATGSNAGGFDAGRVHVYVHEDGRWELEALLHNPADAAAYGHFGRSLALRGDTLAVGALLEDDDAARRGAVHVFTRGRGEWRLQASLDDSSVDGDRFGHAVALAGDTLAVASAWRLRDRSPLPAQLQLFRRDGDAWGEPVRIDVPGNDYALDFALVDDTLLIADAPGLRVFRRDGGAWTEGPPIVLEFRSGFAFDGDTALVYSGGEDSTFAVYRDQGDAWSLQAEFVVPFRPRAFALSGGWIACGFDYNDENYHRRDRVAVLQREDGEWSHHADLDPPPDLPGEYPEFGLPVAINAQWLVAGAPRAGAPEHEQSGMVYVFSNRDGYPVAARLSPEDELDGCGCRTDGGHAGLLVGLLALGRRRRRPR